VTLTTTIRRIALGATLALVAMPTLAAAQSQIRPVVVAGGPLVDLATQSPDPLDGANAHLIAVAHDGSTRFTFIVTGVDAEPGRVFGAHVHVGPCIANQPAAAGGHYRSDGHTADAAHEVWLDFTVRPGGVAVTHTVVPFVIPDGAAHSVVVHAEATGPGGVAGPRLACLPVGF
jgi:Cu/Zn superoxide dismutase